MNDELNQVQKDCLHAADILKWTCEQLAEKVITPDCIEIPLVKLAAQYAEVANSLFSSMPELYEPFETAIARVQHNIRVEMLRYRQLRERGEFWPVIGT